MYNEADIFKGTTDLTEDVKYRRTICRQGAERVSIDDLNQEHKTWGLKGYPLASVYSPIQDFEELYDTETSLVRGTVFSKLDLPFMGESVYKGGNCRG